MNQNVSTVERLNPTLRPTALDQLGSISRVYFNDLLNGPDLEANNPFLRMLRLMRSDGEGQVEGVRAIAAGLSLIPIMQALRHDRWATVPLKTFQSPPQPTTLNELRRFALFGYDLKITPDAIPQIVEINGTNSGMKGFARTQTTVGSGDHDRQRTDRALERHLDGYGAAQRAYIGTVMALGGESSSRFDPIKEFFEDELRILCELKNTSRWESQVHPEWHRRLFSMAADLVEFERRVDNKLACNDWLEPWREFKPLTMPASKENIERLHAQAGGGLIVMKPQRGALGDKVSIGPVEEILTQLADRGWDERYIVEPFIESRGIRSQKTGELHDGCARYVVIGEELENGDIRVRDFGAYWRLCPDPLASGTLESKRANLAKGALTERVSEADLDIMRELVMPLTEDLMRRWPEPDVQLRQATLTVRNGELTSLV